MLNIPETAHGRLVAAWYIAQIMKKECEGVSESLIVRHMAHNPVLNIFHDNAATVAKELSEFFGAEVAPPDPFREGGAFVIDLGTCGTGKDWRAASIAINLQSFHGLDADYGHRDTEGNVQVSGTSLQNFSPLILLFPTLWPFDFREKLTTPDERLASIGTPRREWPRPIDAIKQQIACAKNAALSAVSEKQASHAAGTKEGAPPPPGIS